MKHLPRLLLLALLSVGAAQAGVATRVDLNRDWSFKTDPGSAGERGGWVITSELGFPGIFAAKPTEADEMRVSILREQMPAWADRS